MANLEGEETFEASMLGSADEVVQERICDDELLLIKGLVIVWYYFSHEDIWLKVLNKSI